LGKPEAAIIRFERDSDLWFKTSAALMAALTSGRSLDQPDFDSNAA
jgi:hypothetical protein